jgi:hypothetical protein
MKYIGAAAALRRIMVPNALPSDISTWRDIKTQSVDGAGFSIREDSLK